MKISLFGISIIFTLLVSCTGKVNSLQEGELVLVQEGKQFMYMPAGIIRADGQGSTLNLYTKDSLFVYDGDMRLVNKINVSGVEMATQERTHLTYIDSSLLLNRLGNVYFGSDHNRMFQLVNYKTKQKWQYLFDGLPVKIGQISNSKLKSLDNKATASHEITSVTWEYRFNKADSSFWFPMCLRDYPEKLGLNKSVDKYQFVKVNLHNEVKSFNVPFPLIHIMDKFPQNDIFSIHNQWIDDTTMLYGFPSVSTHYIFHANSGKVDVIEAPYSLLPQELINDSTSNFNVYNCMYDKFILNQGGDGYFRMGKYADMSKGRFNEFIFWHKKDGTITEIENKILDTGFAYAKKDTLYILQPTNAESYFHSQDIKVKKFVVKAKGK